MNTAQTQVQTDKKTKSFSEKELRKIFGFDVGFEITGFADTDDRVPKCDPNYRFDPSTTLAILLGFQYNRRLIIQGYHGTGKSTHIEQVANRLNWPCVRVNLDSHISRIDLIGKDIITTDHGSSVTRFDDGVLTWALKNPAAIVFDEYDAGRPDVMFVIQRVLETDGKLTLLDQNKVINPHPKFRLFATANTIGLGDTTGLYHGTQQLNQGQLDRWSMVTTLDYLRPQAEEDIIYAQHPQSDRTTVKSMVELANLTRQAFQKGDISTLMSPRTVLEWISNAMLLEQAKHPKDKSRDRAFQLTFLNRCDRDERKVIGELYQRCFRTDVFLSHATNDRI